LEDRPSPSTPYQTAVNKHKVLEYKQSLVEFRLLIYACKAWQ